MHAPPEAEGLLQAFRADSPRLAVEILTAVRAHLPSYDVVPTADLERSIGEILQLVDEVLRTHEVPSAGAIDQAKYSAAARSRQDVPMWDIMRAFRIVMDVTRRALLESARAANGPPECAADLTNTLWLFSDNYMVSQVAAFQEQDVARAVTRLRRATRFVSDIVDGGTDRATLDVRARELGLDPDTDLVPSRVRFPDAEDAERAAKQLSADVSRAGERAVFVALGDEVLGVSADIRALSALDGPIAVADPGHVAELAAGFATTHVVLTAARMLGLTGVVHLDDLGWRLAGLQSPELLRHLAALYIEPLVGENGYGPMIAEAVRAYLRADRHVQSAARAIPVHPNTLRYRLRRFEELTGRSLESTDTVIEASLAFEVVARVSESGPARALDLRP